MTKHSSREPGSAKGLCKSAVAHEASVRSALVNLFQSVGLEAEVFGRRPKCRRASFRVRGTLADLLENAQTPGVLGTKPHGYKPKYDVIFLICDLFYCWTAATRQALCTSAFEGPALTTPSAISVIDDDASMRTATENLLSSHGYTVRTFASAEEFLQSGQLKDTSCVIADVQMPVMSGPELMAVIRGQGHLVPFIFITAFPDDSVRAQALKAGAICFLAKPFAGPSLVNCLATALQGHRGGTSS